MMKLPRLQCWKEVSVRILEKLPGGVVMSLWDISTDLDQYECFSLINNLPVKLTRVLLGDALRGHHDQRGLHTRQTEGDQPVRNKQRRRKREGECRNGIEIILYKDY